MAEDVDIALLHLEEAVEALKAERDSAKKECDDYCTVLNHRQGHLIRKLERERDEALALVAKLKG